SDWRRRARPWLLRRARAFTRYRPSARLESDHVGRNSRVDRARGWRRDRFRLPYPGRESNSRGLAAMPSFLASAQDLPEGVALREETPTDRTLLAELYASTREEELRPVPWDDSQKKAFLREQFDLQWDHYRRPYASVEWRVCCV